jgi:hypothetical protein
MAGLLFGKRGKEESFQYLVISGEYLLNFVAENL